MKRKNLTYVVRTLFAILVALVVTSPVLIAVAAPEQFDHARSMLLPNASLVAVLLAVPALYLLRGPVDPR